MNGYVSSSRATLCDQKSGRKLPDLILYLPTKPLDIVVTSSVYHNI
jgi:hypothetical protein